MAFPSVTWGNLLEPGARQEAEQFSALTEGFLSVQHDADGAHTDITADSVTVSGDATIDGDLTVSGDATVSGDVTADDLTADAVTATSATIGGFTLVNDTLSSSLAGLSSFVSGGATDWRLWAGAASGAASPFRVDDDGNVEAVNATITGTLEFNNTVSAAAAVASTHKVAVEINGTTYYLLVTDVP